MPNAYSDHVLLKEATSILFTYFKALPDLRIEKYSILFIYILYHSNLFSTLSCQRYAINSK